MAVGVRDSSVEAEDLRTCDVRRLDRPRAANLAQVEGEPVGIVVLQDADEFMWPGAPADALYVHGVRLLRRFAGRRGRSPDVAVRSAPGARTRQGVSATRREGEQSTDPRLLPVRQVRSRARPGGQALAGRNLPTIRGSRSRELVARN